MLSIYPVFFPCFKCKADACSHTCCQIWEIDIDPDSEARYRSEKGPLGEELAQWMQKSEDGSTCFKLNDEGSCHFLTKEGLCRLVLEKGDAISATSARCTHVSSSTSTLGTLRDRAFL